jgi:4-alpha-glucanotransferase
MSQEPEGWARESLSELASLSGVSTQYHNLKGELCRPSVRTLRRILSSMGYGDMEKSLKQLKGRPFNRLIEPVMAVFEDEQPISITLHIPCPVGLEDDVSVLLSLFAEDGSELETRIINGVVQYGEATYEDIRYIKVETVLDFNRPCGYYMVDARATGPMEALKGKMLLIIAPRRCHTPPRRTWGLTLSLYGIRSRANWGVGDMGNLKAIMDAACGLGAGFVGINPLHATAGSLDHGISPYQPISRLYMNFIYADSSFLHSPDPSEEQRLRDTELVDYDSVAELKLKALRTSFEKFMTTSPEAGLLDDFQLYCQEEGRRLDDFATYMALSGHLRESGLYNEPGRGWRAWPEEYRDPGSPDVAAFRAEHERDILFHKYIQWVLDKQIRNVSDACETMPLGLYGDLAVGSSSGGSDTWTFGEVFAEKMNMGAPPDDFSPFGQNWLFPPIIPESLRESGYSLFIETLRSSMKYFSALRIDHALGLFKTFWIPEGMGADEGAYVNCPHDELLKIIALESVRNDTVIIAEDLGTVSRKVREALASFGMLSYRLLYFERNWEDGTFLPPESYPDASLCAVNTHDLPTMFGFLEASDIMERKALGLYTDERALISALKKREKEKKALKKALLPFMPADRDLMNSMDSLLLAAYSFIASTPSILAAMSLDDALALKVQQNLPGVEKGHPNWRRKYPMDIDSIFGPDSQAQLLGRLVSIFLDARG